MAVDGREPDAHDQDVDFRAAVKRELRNQGRNQEWLALQLGEDRSTISRRLSRSPTLEEVEEIAKALNITPADLLRAAGYIEDETGIEALIAGDVRIAQESRDVLLAAYRAAKERRQ